MMGDRNRWERQEFVLMQELLWGGASQVWTFSIPKLAMLQGAELAC